MPTFRTREERLQDIDRRIGYHKDKITVLEDARGRVIQSGINRTEVRALCELMRTKGKTIEDVQKLLSAM
jgi:hypothetical protein